MAKKTEPESVTLQERFTAFMGVSATILVGVQVLMIALQATETALKAIRQLEFNPEQSTSGDTE